MRYCMGVLTACGALALLVTPAWAHPSTSFHLHSEELVALLVVAAAGGALLVLSRLRSTTPSEE